MNNQRAKGTRLKDLRTARDAAFRQWVGEVGRWQSLRSAPNGNGAAVEEARRRAAQAEDAYRARRNLLAEFLLAAPLRADAQAAPPPQAESACVCACAG
jgi:hypothetical protein